MLLRPQYRLVAPAALYGGGVLQEDYTTADTMTWVTHARTGHATMFDSTGKLTYAPNNVVINSNNFGGTGWSTTTATLTTGVSDPIGGTNATTLTATAPNGNIIQNTGGSLYSYEAAINSIWIRRRTGTGQILFYDPSETAQDITSSVTGSWSQIYYKANGANAPNYLYIVLATSGDAVDIYKACASYVSYETSPRTGDQVITTSSAYYGPRMDYNPATLAKRGLLREMSGTNTIIYSEDISNGNWTKSDCTITANSTTGPNGLSTADTVTATATNGEFYQQGTSTNGVTHVGSMWVKRKTGTGNVYLLDAQGARILNSTDITNWARLTVSATSVSINPFIGLRLGTSGDEVYVWGVQLEASTYATSYIPTINSAVTRNADTLTAALYTSDSVTEYYRKASDLSQTSRTVNPFSGVSSETDSIWVEKFTKP